MAEKVIGVLGGLGPWATLDLFEKILTLTPAGRDQEHLRLIIDNNPKIPDRSPAIFGTGEDPTPALVETARNLERAGADFIAASASVWQHPDGPAVAVAAFGRAIAEALSE